MKQKANNAVFGRGRIIALAACLLLLLASVCLLAVGAFAAQADGWSAISLEEEYSYGDTFTVEKRTYTKDQKSYDAECLAVLPDGTQTKAESIGLDQAGIYELRYSVLCDGALYTDVQSFKVQYPAYYYNSEGTSVTYGKGNFASGIHGDGLVVRLAQNDTLTFTHLIDVNDITKDVTLFSGYITPDTRGVADFTRFYITLTDSENPDIYLTLMYCSYIYDSQSGGWAYSSAAGNGQQFTGLHPTDGLRIDDGFGVNSYATFAAWRAGSNIPSDTYLVTFRYDPETKIVYSNGDNGYNYNTFVIDLDNAEYFHTLWQGFPSGKVRLSVSAGNYSSSTANFCVLSVFGLGEEGELADDSKKVFYDREGPVVTVNSAHADDMPVAVVGKDYPVPDATAYDEYAGECAVKVSAWYNYESASPVSVPIRDGKIFIGRPGTYALVYSAQDKLGTPGEKICWVTADDSPETLTLELPSDTTAHMGEFFTVPEPLRVSGGSGDKSVTVSVTSPSGAEVLQKNGFRIEETGKYTVTYTAVDYVGQQVSDSFTVTVSEEDSLQLDTQPVFYPLYVSGATYRLPSINVYVYRNKTLSVEPCTVKVTDGNGTKEYAAGEEFVPFVESNGGEITFEVLYGGEGGTSFGTYKASAILAYQENEEYGDTEFSESNYFFGTGFEKSASSDGMTFRTQENSFEWTFANALLAKNFAISVADVSNVSSDAAIRITLTDAGDPNNTVSAILQNDGSVTYLQVGGVSVQLGYAFSDTGDVAELSFNGNSFYYGSAAYPVSETDAGAAFEGFSSDKVFLTVSFTNTRAGASYTVRSIGNYSFSGNYENFSVPEIKIAGNYGGAQQIGTVCTLPAAYAYDVFSPMIRFTVTVRKNGSVMRDNDGLLLENVDPTREYSITLDEYGRYSVQYSAEAYGFETLRVNDYTSYAINVYDDVAPVITYKTSYWKEVKVGDEMRLPEYTVSDNLEGELLVNIYIRKPDGKLEKLTEGVYTATMQGVYEFRLMVTDAAGNVTMDRFPVTVS